VAVGVPLTLARCSGVAAVEHAHARVHLTSVPRIGAHVSVAGGILNAPANAVEATCDTFQIWVSSPRAWRLPALDPATDERFRQLVADAGLAPVFIHAPYLVNFASTSQMTIDNSVAVVVATLDKAAAMCAGYDLHDPIAAGATADELDKLLHGRLALVHTTSGQVVAEWRDDR
jgi:endonuclease IV